MAVANLRFQRHSRISLTVFPHKRVDGREYELEVCDVKQFQAATAKWVSILGGTLGLGRR